MILSLKHYPIAMMMMMILSFITVLSHAQTADSLKVATVQEKSETILLRMERELALTREQSVRLKDILIGRFQSLNQGASTLETVNSKAVQKIKIILTKEQYVLYQELQSKKKQEKAKYLKDHPGFTFLREDLEMEF